MLRQLLQEEIQRRGISVRRAAKEMQLSHTSLHRFLNGSKAEYSSMVKIASWLSIPISSLVDVGSNISTPDTIASRLALLLHRNPALAATFDQILQSYGDGELSADDVQEIMNFTAFKITANHKAVAKI